MKDRPILFSGAMVKAILEGRKTQTRRIVKCGCNSWHIDRLLGDWSLSEDPHQLTAEEHAARPWRWRGKTPAEIGDWVEVIQTDVDDNVTLPVRCPFMEGTQLWVKETFGVHQAFESWYDEGNLDIGPGLVHFRADGDHAPGVSKWRPSIFMPRALSRTTLEITAIRVERLQEISEGDAIAEGFLPCADENPGNGGCFDWYRGLWDSINGDGSWASNPWVWVITFKRIKP